MRGRGASSTAVKFPTAARRRPSSLMSNLKTCGALLLGNRPWTAFRTYDVAAPVVGLTDISRRLIDPETTR